MFRYKVFRCKREELTGDERKLHNEELRDYLLLTKYSVYQIKEDERLAGHVARVEEKSNAYRVLVGKQKKRDHLEDVNVDGRITFK